MTDDVYEELARRLCAAAISYQMGNKSIDYTMKSYIKDAEGRRLLASACAAGRYRDGHE